MSPTTNNPDRDPDLGDAARAAFAEMLGTTDFDIVAQVAGRMPSGEEVRLLHAAVRGEPNRAASLVVDSSGRAHPRRRLEALAGRDLFAPDVHLPERPVAVPVEPVAIEPATDDLTLPECVTESETITVTVPTGASPKADLYLLADATGSMDSIIGAVQAGIGAVVADPALASFDIAWGAGNYKDFPIPDSSPYAFQHQLAPTPGHAAVTAAVATWAATGGLDTPEAQLYALQQVATDPTIGWRPDSKRIVVWFGDAPGHDPICTAVSGVADITEASATAALVAAGITVVAISTDTGVAGALDGDPRAGAIDYAGCPVEGYPGQATRITAATPGGSHTTGVNAASIIATLVSLISTAVHSTGKVNLQPTGASAAFVTSITPAGGYGPLPGNVEHVLQFDVTWTGVRQCRDEDQVFAGTVDVVADGVVVTSKPVRISVPSCRWHHSVEMICCTQPSDRGGGDHGHDDHDDKCETVVDGRYATAVTIYNPATCPVTVEKYFAPLVLHSDPVGREPRTTRARPFAKLKLGPGEATLEDCCTLEEAVGPIGGPLVLGVLDVVADRALDVTVTHTAATASELVSSIDARTITPRRS
jgi:hypothetical protein